MPVEVLMSMLIFSRTLEYPKEVLLPIVEYINQDNAERFADYIGAICNLKNIGKTSAEIMELIESAYKARNESDD